MTAHSKLRAFTLPATALLAVVVAIGFTSHAQAFCSSCNTPAATYSAGYAAPVAYSAAYAPTYTTAYAPPVAYTTAYAPAYTTANTGWYPGRFLGRVNRSIWGYPTTTYYAPTYTAAYAPTYTAAYAPAYITAYAAPACSTCSASYAPAPACSTCTASYAPACSSCSTCDTYATAAPACATCSASAVAPASYTESVAVPAESTYSTPSSSSTSTGGSLEPTPALPPDANVPATRSPQEVQKPTPAEPPLPLPTDTEANSTDDSATNLQPPKLFDPNDRTASRHAAPVWTAVYHKVSGAERTVQPVSLQQVELDAAGWTSASK